MAKRIGIDARFFGSVGKGLGRYTQKLIENLEKIDQENEYYIFLSKENFDECQVRQSNFHKVLADCRWYTWAEQLRMPAILRKYDLDLVHFPHFNVPLLYRGRFVVTIHDLILVHFPTARSSTLNRFFYWLKFGAYRVVIRSAIARAEKVIAVSEFTRNDILKSYPFVAPEKTVTTYEACDDYCLLSPNKDEKILARYGIIKPYVVYVGNVYPHKNPERLALAFQQLAERGIELKLVFVGAEDYFYARLKKFVEDQQIQNIIFAGFVPDYELDTLFHNTLAYVRPSLYEGFELPPLEAMAKGVPVLTSNHSCALEILGDSAYYFDALDVKAIARALEEITKNEPLRQELIQKGYEQIKKYSWKKMAQETLEIYRSATEK